MNFAHYISLHARYRAEHPALESGAGTVTYSELDAAAAGISGGLMERGVGKGDVVGVMLRDTPEHICALLGVMRRGAIVLPMDWRWKRPEVTSAVERFSPCLVIVEGGQVMVADAPAVPMASLLSAPADPAPPAPLENEPVFYAITSGTTGESKAAILTHEQMYARFIYYLTDLMISKEDRFCCVFPLAYAAGRALSLVHLCVGATVIILPTLFGPEELVAAVRDRNITSLGVPPHVSRGLLKLTKENCAAPLMGELRNFISMTSGLNLEEKAAIRKRISPALVETYANMAGGVVTVLRNGDHDIAPDSVGRPVHGAEVQIVDDEGNPLPAGTAGQVRHRGDGVASGFLLPGESGNEKFQDGWLYPGDIGSLDENGFLYLYGRSTEIIKFAGMTVHATEVELALAEFPGVTEAAVIGAPSAEYGEEVVACIVTESPVRQNDLIAHCKRRLAPYKVPRRLHIIESLPRNSAGKVVKAKLLERFF